jgi:histidinol-phosphatase (PHP family)
MTDSHVHLYPHQFPHHSHPLTPPEGHYPLQRIERYVRTAASRGVNEIAFTEHFYRCVESEDVLGPFWEQQAGDLGQHTREDVIADRKMSLERYVDVVLRAKDAGLPVLLGLEVDFFPETIDEVLRFIEPYPFDILVGSVHWIGGWGFDKPHGFDEWERRGYRTVYEQYFDLAAELAGSGNVDVLAHPDRVKMRGHRLESEPLDLYEKLVTAARSGGTAMELNSGGLRHPVEEVYSTPSMLETYAEGSLDLTFGSDGHMPDGTAWKFDELTAMALAAGFTHTVTFRERKPSPEPLVVAENLTGPTG